MQTKRFLDPLWIRLLLVAACAFWTALEYANDQIGWAAIAACATLYGVWSLLLNYGRP
ncbi:hypothetical protein [Aquamicrobium zhengzhouense]|uniref:DUF3329 domain-containing protein n=1 Tax=Aquamicrobium zhengzhouense TaxID=2781738 RepID=A0ABS0SFY9_9HYPH|nr:hypothetical protein [Aquamicrobium zhengzhouense]MBI1622219.1 hypothetical protein [Aquamicrobium zhengzhouense]